ncbi:MAG: hypothetical protein ACOC5J_03180 [Gemmatimonadota bacterium]
MSITELSVLPHGTRVRVKRGRYPVAADLVGRTGVVVEHSQYFPNRVDVSLDGDPRIHTFALDETELVSVPAALTSDRVDAKKRLARP